MALRRLLEALAKGGMIGGSADEALPGEG